MKEKKYEIINNTIEYDNHTLYRIVALKNFGEYPFRVRKGERGGYVESEDNLSQEGDCWIYDIAAAYGNAQVYGNAKIKDVANVYDNAQVYENAIVEGAAKIRDNSEVFGNAQVYGCSYVYGNSKVYDDAAVFGFSHVKNKNLHGKDIVNTEKFIPLK